MGGICERQSGRMDQKHRTGNIDRRCWRIQKYYSGIGKEFTTKWSSNLLEGKSRRILCQFTSSYGLLFKSFGITLVLNILNFTSIFQPWFEKTLIHIKAISWEQNWCVCEIDPKYIWEK